MKVQSLFLKATKIKRKKENTDEEKDSIFVKNNSNTASDEGGPEFVRPILNKTFNLNLSRNQASRLNSFVFLVCWLVALIRVYHLL